jgi:hypothetical protein
MNALKIEIAGGRTAFEPGDELAGQATWQLNKLPHTVELRLFWFTSGAGNQDIGVVETVRFEQFSMNDSRSFRFRLPAAPYSFEGNLITLNWALELVGSPFKEVERVEVVIAPGGKAVQLGTLPQSEEKKTLFGFGKR